MGSISPSPSATPIRIATLECGPPLPKTRTRYPGYGNVFEALLRAGARELGSIDPESGLVFSHYDVSERPDVYPDLEDVDAILITGSKHDSFANTPWILKLVAFTTQVLAQDRVRAIGVCFGHQIVGRALGCKVGRSPDGWETAVNEVRLTEMGRKVFRSDALQIHQMHRDMVFHYPEGVEELGSSPRCQVQGMYVPKHLLTVQGHPEFNQEIMEEILETRHAAGIFNDNEFDEGMKRVVKPHDGLIVSQAFLRFLME